MVKPKYNLPGPDQDDQAAARHWLAGLADHYGEAEHRRLAQACERMIQCRGGHRLETGETEARHLLSTADILFGLRMDADTLCAALLNGCLGRDDVITEALLSDEFGDGLARMVVDLGRIGQLANVDRVVAEKDQQQHEENLRRLLLGIAEDVRVVLVVLAERVHLMRAAKNLPAPRRQELAQDTQRVYAPLANRLGIWQIKWELEDLALRYLHPEDYKRIAKLLKERRGERQEYIARVIDTLKAELERAGVKASVTGRPKHIYSIWKKMQRKGVDIEQIFDLRAVRILVDDIPSCYLALGIVHGLWRHLPSEFDDYIATPKGNMYQSLHTAVIGPEEKPLEVQIRTYDMHRHAEYGVAAHWAYKESKGHDAEFQRRVTWMRNWLELKNEGDQGGDFVERFKAEFEPVHVYVLTPQAKVIELPRGATPLDFAYAIHSEIGNHCRGARVDGRIVPLTHQLTSGETVEILTQKNATPSRDWLSPHHHYMVTAKARNRVRQWLKQQDFERYLGEGRALLDKELERLGIGAKPQLDRLAPRWNLRGADDLFAAIGRGDVSAAQVARAADEGRHEAADSEPALPRRLMRPPTREQHDGKPRVIVDGVEDLMTQMATCCKPVPYDRLVGFVTRGRGVTVHRRGCRNVRNLPEADRDRLIDVTWADQPNQTRYPVDLLVIAAERTGLLRDVSSIFADARVNVTRLQSQTDPADDVATMQFTVEVADSDELEQVLTRLRQLPDVIEVDRRR
jgi:GTP pyrophosphokinase